MSAPATAEAASRWDDLLASEPDLDGSIEAWRGDLLERGLELEGRPLCTVARPHFVDEERLDHQAAIAALVMSALQKVRAALASDEELYRVHLGGLHDWIGGLLALEPRVAGEGALVRLDASLARTQLHFIEANADSPGGAGHNDAILDFFARMPVYERFSQDYALRPLRLQGHQLAALLDSWEEWGGKDVPTIGILTRRGDPAAISGTNMDRDFYTSQGVETVVTFPDELSFTGGRLRAREIEVDLVHRACPTHGFVGGAEVLEPLFEAIRAEAVCLVNPFRSELLGHKAVFALLTEARPEFGFSAAERAAVDAHVPWARLVLDGRTTGADGEAVDLIEHIRSNRNQLVLKPAHEFGGRGVVLGWEQDDAAWDRAIEDALAAEFVVQRRVELQREDYPSLEPGLPTRRLYEDTDPFMFRGEFGGQLTRLSGTEMTNVHADGCVCASVAVTPIRH